MASETPENDPNSVEHLQQQLAEQGRTMAALQKQVAELSRQLARRMQHFIEPVILPKEILGQARSWLEECASRWGEPGLFPRIGEAMLTSPVDDKTRKVVLHLACGLNVKGQTTTGVRDEHGREIEDGNTIILNRVLLRNRRVTHLPPPPISVLLHEITHAVDPVFESDFQWLNHSGHQRVVVNPGELYRLPSEQRAFTAMWMEDLRIDMANAGELTPDDRISDYRGRLEEFAWFCAECPEFGNQNRNHFEEMIEALKNH
jgi:hypothetical protein